MFKKKVELPTGVKTEIRDTQEGAVNVIYKVREEFNNPIKT